MAVLLVVGTTLASTAPLAAAPAGAAATGYDLASVENLYATDLLARANAERAVRNSPNQPVPPLQMNAAMNAAAQAWAVHIATLGGVVDPPLAGCGAGALCVLAGNAGSSGNGFWPGDGSDGMESAYMTSAPHRENMLNAGYDTVGVGVACSGGQAWTVELFGYASSEMAAAGQRDAAQNLIEGNPVSAAPSVAGTNTGIPVFCPGQTSGPNGQITATGGPVPYPYPVPPVGAPPAPPPPPAPTYVGITAAAGDGGYWVARSDGAVSPHGTAASYGSMQGKPLAAPITHIVGTADGRGYWLVAGDGGIFAFGDAGFYGSMGGHALNAPVVDMTPTPDGLGYWLVASDGGIFAFGDAPFRGSTGGLALNAPVVAMAADAAGTGYWTVGADGGIFAFGGAPFRGSAGGLVLQSPVVGIAVDQVTDGYWLVAADGGVFAYDAPFLGAG